MTTTELTYGSLCSGYSGLDSGVQSVLGGRTVWVSEFDDDASRVLAHHWPDVPNLGDLTTTDWTRVPRVDVITAGFPCQPFSHAGLRLGANDPRHLWPHISHAIGVLRPRLVVLENVRGLLSGQGEPDTPEVAELADEADRLGRILTLIDHKKAKAARRGQADRVGRLKADTHRITQLRRPVVVALRRARRGIIRAIGAVLRDLANHGYDAQWHGIRAADVGGAHGRFRVFIFATARDADLTGLEGRGPDGRADQRAPREAGLGPVAHVPGQLTLLPTPEAKLAASGPDYARMSREGSGGHDLTTAVALLPTPRATRGGSATETAALLPTPRATDGSKGGPNQRGSSGDLMLPSAVQLIPTPNAGLGEHRRDNGQDPVRRRAQGRQVSTADVACHEMTAQDWGPYEAAIRRCEQAWGRDAPAPTEAGPKGGQRLAPLFVEFLMGLPAGHVTHPDIWAGKTPSAARNAQLKILGNGVVPQQAAAATRLWLGQPLPAIDPPAELLPTPAVNDMGAAYTPQTWDAWTDRMKTEHGNGNGHGKSLAIEALRLQTTSTNH